MKPQQEHGTGSASTFDVAVIGGGFFGCCLALFLRSVCERVVLIEAEDALLDRASRVNQARIHTGFHYPRSFVTALRSRILQARFAADFADAVVDDFDMLYAIARRRSKVSAQRFHRMFSAMDAPISRAQRPSKALFNSELIEDVFLCKEFAFNWKILRDRLARQLDIHGVDVRTGTAVARVGKRADQAELELADGRGLRANAVFNVTYAGINSLLAESGIERLGLKFELAEIALVEPPADLLTMGVTVMDGPFFSSMPYPSENLHSLSHVRYTPHFSWIDQHGGDSAYEVASKLVRVSRSRHMILDAQRYLPCFADARLVKSLFDVKVVRVRNEMDDGRPILFHKHAGAPQIYTVMGAKIDNVYDLLDVIPLADERWQNATDRLLFS